MSADLRVAVVLPAAGQSRRFVHEGKGASKLETEIDGRAVLLRSVELFTRRSAVEQIVVAADPDRVEEFQRRWGDRLGLLGVRIVPGGRRGRWETVHEALGAVDDGTTHVAVHDAARPITPPDVLDRVFSAAEQHPAVVPATRVASTVKRLEEEPLEAETPGDPLDAVLGPDKGTVAARRVLETVPRGNLWLTETPQVFERRLLDRAYQQIPDGTVDAEQITDDAGLVEALGERVVAVEGDAFNIKITVPSDVTLADRVVRSRRSGGDEDGGAKRKFPTWAESEEE